MYNSKLKIKDNLKICNVLQNYFSSFYLIIQFKLYKNYNYYKIKDQNFSLK